MTSFNRQSILCRCPNDIAKKLDISIFAELDSTNTYLKKLAREGAEEGTVIIAERQTAGRGRLGRSFYSDANGLYMSLLLRPRVAAENAVHITAMAAVAMAKAVERISGKDAQIKWVNDIFINGKKVCGILCESAFDENAVTDYVVIGAGVNITEPKGGFPEDIRGVAGALFHESETAEHRPELAAAFLEELFKEYEKLNEGHFLAEYRRRSLVTGRRVAVIAPNGTREGTAVAIDDDCRLVVSFDGGETEHISTGEVSVRLR